MILILLLIKISMDDSLLSKMTSPCDTADV